MKHLFFTLLLVLGAGAQYARAQPGSGGPTPGAAPTQTPIDGGASLLLTGGVAYGLRKLRAHRAAKR